MTPSHNTFAGSGRGQGNPFRASQTRPGTIPYLCLDGEDLESLWERFLSHGRRGQIVGPHGSGKSTLMLDLLSRLRAAGIGACRLRVDSQRGWQRVHRQQVRRAPAGTVVAIDGYDQIGVLTRMLLPSCLAWRSLGLLVTTHRVQAGLPIVRRTSMDEQLARLVIRAYLERAVPGLAQDESAVWLASLDTRLQRHHGNLREVLFELYEVAAGV